MAETRSTAGGDHNKPYGNVEYADPGYQKDGVSRYPIDTEEHAREALAYISVAKNAAKYSPEDLAKVKGHIEAACKKFGIHMSDQSGSDHQMTARSDEFSGVETRAAASVDTVDFGERIITVVAVPYEQSTSVLYRGEVYSELFSRSAFEGIQNRQQAIPVTASLQIPNPNHEGGHLVGRVINAYPDSEPGLVTDVKISDTERGRETLELARDGMVSASVGFKMKNPHQDQQLDRHNRTRRINRAFIDHLAFVAVPAYPDAKVLAMRGNDGFESEMPPFAKTPRMDEFLNDPIIRAALTGNREV